MTEFVYLGSLPYENQAIGLRIEPSENGTPFAADLPPDVEANMLARGLAVRVPASARRSKKEE